MAKNIPVSQREEYAPSASTEFLWWLSTAEKELLYDAVVDRNRYAIIGMTVLATWGFATLAWSYFFFTVSGSYWSALLLGILMGLIILTIDRALIKGINRSNKGRLLPLAFRAALALTIGTFMAQPALLYLFRKEIQLQARADNEQRQLQNNKLIDSTYSAQKSALLQNKSTLEQALQQQYAGVEAARANFLAEADGSGGTGKVGIEAIALAKQKEYLKLDAAYQELLQQTREKLKAIDQSVATIDSNIQKDQQLYAAQFNDGFLTQIEALNHLIDRNPALASRYYLLVAILLMIELMPVLAKSMLPTGTYEERVWLRENLEKELSKANTEREQALKELYNRLALDSDKQAITRFFEITSADREAKMASFSEKWRNDQHQRFDGLWEKMKRDILSKQEG